MMIQIDSRKVYREESTAEADLFQQKAPVKTRRVKTPDPSGYTPARSFIAKEIFFPIIKKRVLLL
jgi:hypothetical protein